MNKFFSKVYGWLFIGLLITFISGYYISTNEILMEKLLGSPFVFVIFIIEIVIAISISARLNKLSPITAEILYLVYSVLTGITFSTLFQIFKLGSIIYIFVIAAILFGIFALIGYFTKIDLSKISIILFIGLIAILVLELINIFALNNTLDIVSSIISIIIFFGYTAYDMQRIKMYEGDTLAIYGAFELYLDFINLFINLLELFGDRKDN